MDEKTQRESLLEDKIAKLEAELVAPKATELKKLQERIKALESDNEELFVRCSTYLERKGRPPQ